MQDVMPGEVGEIAHRSAHLMQGYFHDDKRTRSALEGGWFHCGDLATIDEDGYITMVDRKKDMLKTGGENVASLPKNPSGKLLKRLMRQGLAG
jgi:fatty-acyl-CoA synthase